jgi:hypothetical protein
MKMTPNSCWSDRADRVSVSFCALLTARRSASRCQAFMKSKHLLVRYPPSASDSEKGEGNSYSKRSATPDVDRLIMKMALVTFCLSVFCGLIRAETQPPERKVESNSVVSTRNPNIRIDIPENARYVGADRWNLYGVADCEVHVFVKADEKKIVQSFYWIQFEGYLPEKPNQRYDYTKDRKMVIDGLEFHLKARFGPTSEKPKPGSDFQHVLNLISAGGYNLPSDMMNVRLVYLPDSSHRKELMVIYAEDMASTGYSSTNLMKGGKIRPEWTEIEDALIERAKKQIRFHLRN